MDWHLAKKVEIGQLFSKLAIHSAQFASVNEYSLYTVLMPAVHSRRGNPRQRESKNVDGNTRLALDPLV